jgi:hypothetical protein
MSNIPPKRRRFGSLIPALGEFKSIDSLMNLNMAALQEEALLVDDAKVYEKLQTRLNSIASILETAAQERPKSNTNNSAPSSKISDLVNRDPEPELDKTDNVAIQGCPYDTHEISLPEATTNHSVAGRRSSAETKATSWSQEMTSGELTMSRSSSHDNVMEPMATVIPAEVLRLLTLTGFLTTPEELGKLLLLTCRSFALSLGDDFCWEMICRSKWSNSGRIPTSFIQDRGYQWYFHQMSQGEIMDDRPRLGAPSLTLHNLVVLLSIRDGNDAEVYSEILSPHGLESLVQDGTVTIDLEEPVLSAECLEDNFQDHLLPAEKCRNWMASVDFLRLDNNQSCCIHDSCDVEWEYEEDDGFDCRYQFTGEDDRYGRLDFTPQFQRLELTDEGRLLERRIQLGDFFSSDRLEGTGYQGFRVHVSLLCYQSKSLDDPHMVQFEFRHAKLDVFQLVGDYQQGELLHGDLSLHLWNELLGWDG